MKTLAAWQNFYVIMGSSAGGLIGLQFVVLSLITNTRTSRIDPQAGGAFSTPTIIHFSSVLTIAAILCAPWDAVDFPAGLCGLLGVGAAIYGVMVVRRLRRQTVYRLEFEDWLFHALLPALAYGGVITSAIVAEFQGRLALFGIAAAVLLLLLIGIHNAWDAVTYHIFFRKNEE